MRNPVIGTAHFGPVYKRKIHVYEMRKSGPVYSWSTNAARTCREAIARARALYPNRDFVAHFAKD